MFTKAFFSVFLLFLTVVAGLQGPTKCPNVATIRISRGSSSSSQLHLQSFLKSSEVFQKEKAPTTEPTVVEGVGPEGCRLPSPSKINTLPKVAQGKAFVGIFAALSLGTQALAGLFMDLGQQYAWFETWQLTWPLLGAIYLAAGITHFTLEEEYSNIYPPRGTWGLWYLPGSKEFHVQWTGVAEILGGMGLLVGGLLDVLNIGSPHLLSPVGLTSDSAAALFLLTVAVTPANIYMYTHGARLPKDGPALPLVGHAIRGTFQVILLALFYEMGSETFGYWISQVN